MKFYQMYKMTKTRGRALVINNRDGISKKTGQRGRAGSEHDYVNITNMLKKFGFVISNLSADKDWNAQVDRCDQIDYLFVQVKFLALW